MGYYTNFTMEIYDSDGKSATDTIQEEVDVDEILMYPEEYRGDVVEAIRYIKKNDDAYYGLLSEERCKWYDYKDAMEEVSRLYPKLVFVLHGEGEEQGDVWTAYFCNGRYMEIRPELKWPYFHIKEFANEN